MRRLIATLLVLTPSICSAQTSATGAIDDVRRDARVHLGPLYFTPGVLLKELGVDGNVFNAAGERKSDFTFTVAPKVDAWVPVARRFLLRATSETDLVWYAHYRSERSINPQVSGRAEAYAHRLTLFAEDAYVNTRQRPNYEIDIRSRHVDNTGVAGAELRVTPKFSVEVSGHQERTRYDADAVFDGTSLQRTLNQDTTGVRGVVRHRLTPLTTLAVRYERLRDEFPFSHNRDSRSYRVMPGVEFKPRALIKGTAYVGYRQFTPTDLASLPKFNGLVAQLGLSYTMLGATTFGVSYRRDLTYSYEELQPFFIANGLGGSLRRAIGGRFDVLLSVDRYTYDYQDLLAALPNVSSVPLPARTDTTWNYGSSLGYRLGSNGRVGLGASYWKRESTTVQFRHYDNLRFGTTVTYGF
ncbi:MAG: putative beta-barrel porin 2 [Acidobacteriota bacterium]|jgi:hypothetical protein